MTTEEKQGYRLQVFYQELADDADFPGLATTTRTPTYHLARTRIDEANEEHKTDPRIARQRLFIIKTIIFLSLLSFGIKACKSNVDIA